MQESGHGAGSRFRARLGRRYSEAHSGLIARFVPARLIVPHAWPCGVRDVAAERIVCLADPQFVADCRGSWAGPWRPPGRPVILSGLVSPRDLNLRAVRWLNYLGRIIHGGS
jgi:hypothetical protein